MNKYAVPRIAFINKMDRTGADFFAAVTSMRERLGAKAQPIFIPIGAEEAFIGLIDLASMQAIIYDNSDASGMKYETVEIPAEYQDQAVASRESLIQKLADCDDTLADLYLGGGEVTADALRDAIRRATIEQGFCAVIPGSAFKNKGVQSVLESVINYLPAPLDLPPMKGEDSKGRVIEVAPDDNAKVAGLAFKLMNDPYVGKLVFFRVYAGSLKKGNTLFNARTGKTERISRLLVLKADARDDIEAAYSGDICALVGARDIMTGDTLSTKGYDLRLEPPTFPEPVISMSIEPKTSADQEKMAVGLQRLAEEDPDLRGQHRRRLGKPSLPVWASCTLRSLKTASFVNSRSVPLPDVPKLPTAKLSVLPAKEKANLSASGGKGQYGHARIKSNHSNAERALKWKIKPQAASFQRNLSSRPWTVSVKQPVTV